MATTDDSPNIQPADTDGTANQPTVATSADSSNSQSNDTGITAEHPALATSPVYVGTTTEKQQNTIQMSLQPIACCCLFDQSFGIGSSALLPEAAPQFDRLKRLIDKLINHNSGIKPPLSVFGHADSSGDGDFNKKWSGRRAEAVYAALTRRTDMWERLYSNPLASGPTPADTWGLKSLQVMLKALSFDPGTTDGATSPATDAAIKAFQSRNGLPIDGDPNQATREKLFRKYMDLLCASGSEAGNASPDSASIPLSYTVDKADFLGQGSDSGGKADYQGCSDFNPVLVFSQQEQSDFEAATDKKALYAAAAPNRRVLVYLFEPGAKASLDRWPCPSTSEASDNCKKRFFANAEKPRLPGQARRLYEQTKDTFVCRFYDRLADGSPCEQNAPARVGLPSVQMDTVAFKKLTPPSVQMDTVAFKKLTPPSVQMDTVAFKKLTPPSVQMDTVAFKKLSPPSVQMDTVAFKKSDSH